VHPEICISAVEHQHLSTPQARAGRRLPLRRPLSVPNSTQPSLLLLVVHFDVLPELPLVLKVPDRIHRIVVANARRGRHDHHRRHVRRRPLEDGVVEEARDGRLLLQAAGHPRRLRHGARRVFVI